MLEAKYEFIKKNIFLIAQVNENTGLQKLVMRKINLRDGSIIIEDAIDCIHTAIADIPAEELEEILTDEEESEEYYKELLYIRSSENLKEIDLNPEEKFIALKSWVQGIAEAGLGAFWVQTELEQAGNLMYPIASVLMKFIVKAIPDFLPFYLDKIKQDSQYQGLTYTSTLIANIDPIIQMLAQGIIETEHLDYIIKKMLKIGIPNSYFLDNGYFSRLIALIQNEKLHERYIKVIDEFVVGRGIIENLDFNERRLIYLLVLNLGDSINYFVENFQNIARKFFFISNNHITKLYLNSRDFLNFFELNQGLESLEELYSTQTDLNIIPESVSNLQNLKTLWLGSNPFTSLPNSFGNLRSLKNLNLYNSRLKSLPDSFGDLESLEILNLGHNRLSSLSPTIGNLRALKEFYIIANNLKILPESIGSLSSLEVLDLQMNELESLPNSLGSLSNLKELRLNQNNLKSLPVSIGKLSSLEKLSIQTNKIQELPESIVKLTSLKRLNIRNNPLKRSEKINNWLDFLKKNNCAIYD